MLYFKNSELAENHHITLRTVLNWIQATKEGRLNLTLHTEKGKPYVANTAGNIATITRLVEDGRKYRNTKAAKTITPRPEFYNFYTPGQIFDIITQIEIHHEIPRQYNYFDGGADHWDAYTYRLAADEAPNTLNGTIKLLKRNQDYIDGLLERYSRVNIIDIGVGNALPVRNLLEHLLEQGKLGRYIALDISPAILEIAQRNITQWFDGRVPFEGYEHDINYDRFSQLLIDEYVSHGSQNTVNLVLFLGGTLANQRNPDSGLRLIHDSMGINDLLMHTIKLDTKASRRYFDFNVVPGEAKLPPIHRLVVDLLNIDEGFYEVEREYDEHRRQRLEKIRLKVAVTIKFVFPAGERLVKLNKDDRLLVWRSWQQTASDVMRQFDQNELYLLQTSQSEDQEYMLTVSRVKRD